MVRASDECDDPEMPTNVNDLIEARPQPPARPQPGKQFLGTNDEAEPYGVCSQILIAISYILTIITFPISVFACIKVFLNFL